MVKKVLPGKIPNYVWEQDMEADIGNLVIVVIDDEWDWSEGDPASLNPDEAVLAQLCYQACKMPDVRGIGFFPLPPIPEDVPIILEFVQQWLDCIASSDTRIYFLVDVLYGLGNFGAANFFVEGLTTPPYSYPQDNIAYLTKAGPGRDDYLREGHKCFEKAKQAFYAQKNGKFHPELLAFLGKGWHEDKFIDDAIQLYAQAWEARWTVKGWKHECFEDKGSDQLRLLTAWLDISIDALYFSPDKGESAKSLMIWDEDCPWESAPGRVVGRRAIQGKVLNAVLKKLEIPFDPILDEEFIAMPCVPCFPFLVSLRSVLWRCEKEGAPVKEMHFFEIYPHFNVFRLKLPLRNHHRLERKFSGTERQGYFTKSLIDLTHCRTHELTKESKGIGKKYIHLFAEGTDTEKEAERKVVKPRFDQNRIDFIWRCR